MIHHFAPLDAFSIRDSSAKSKKKFSCIFKPFGAFFSAFSPTLKRSFDFFFAKKKRPPQDVVAASFSFPKYSFLRQTQFLSRYFDKIFFPFLFKTVKIVPTHELRRRFSCPIGRDFHNRPDGSRVLRTARDCFNSPPSVQAPPAFCASARQRWRGSWRGTASPHQAPSGSLPPCGAGRPPYTHWRRGTVRGNGPPPF